MPANRIAKWDGAGWNALAAGLNGFMSGPGTGRGRQPLRRGRFTTAGNKASSYIARWTAAEGRSISGPGAYTFYANNLPVTIVVPPGGQGDLARINIQRFDKSHPNASSSLQTGYYWQIEGLNASGGAASGYSVDLTLSAPGFTPDGDDQVVVTPDQAQRGTARPLRIPPTRSPATA